MDHRTDRAAQLALNEFIVKVNSRCNLACDYCYVYSLGDETWRKQPIFMSDETVIRTAERIGEHAVAHEMGTVRVVFHGGEPLLSGGKGLVHFSSTMRRVLPAGVRPAFTVQTNGTLLDTETLDLLLHAGIRVGVSLDGGREHLNRHRILHDGSPSYGAVQEALRRLSQPPFSKIFAGLLCTIDLRNDPVEVYESLIEHSPPMVDFLLPHANWSRRPPSPPNAGNTVPYATWLIEIFERWYNAPRPETRVRIFEGLIGGALNMPRPADQLGLLPARDIVIETDGQIEQVDALKSAYPGAAATGLNIVDHSFDDALSHPAVRARQLGLEGLAATCRACDVVEICGGGHYAHRYRRRDGSGFMNPSVYCPDLYALATHVRSRVATSIGHAAPGA